MNAPTHTTDQYSVAKIAFVDIVCGLLSATREHDAAKTNAKTAIIDAYSNGEIPAWQAINLIQNYELEYA